MRRYIKLREKVSFEKNRKPVKKKKRGVKALKGPRRGGEGLKKNRADPLGKANTRKTKKGRGLGRT